MRSFVVLSSSLLLSLSLLCGCATGTIGPASPEQIWEASAAWQEAYDSRDPARITALYDKEAVLIGTTAKNVAASPAAIADYFKDAASRPTARVRIGEQHIRVYGDTAVNSGTYVFSEVRNGESVARPARFTFVFRKREGTWLLVAHHSSFVP